MSGLADKVAKLERLLQVYKQENENLKLKVQLLDAENAFLRSSTAAGEFEELFAQQFDGLFSTSLSLSLLVCVGVFSSLSL